MKRKAFTLVEIIVAVACIAIISSIAMLQYNKFLEDANEEKWDIMFKHSHSIANQIYKSYLLDGNEPTIPNPPAVRVYTGKELTNFANYTRGKFENGHTLKFSGTAGTFDSATIEANTFNVSAIVNDNDETTWNFYYMIDTEGKLDSIMVVNNGMYSIDGEEVLKP